MKRITCNLLLAGILSFSVANMALAENCPSCGISNASAIIPAASGVVLLGSMSMVAGSGQVVVESVAAVGDGFVVIIKSLADGSKATVQLSGKALQGASVVVGTVVNASATTTGYLLVASGKVIAFIPNEVGQALLHHSKVES